MRSGLHKRARRPCTALTRQQPGFLETALDAVTSNSRRRRLVWVTACCLVLGLTVDAQKVKVGYDKGVDFSKYKTYTWAAPSMPPSRPLLYAMVVDSIDYELKNRGLQKTDKNGDLILIETGGIGFGINAAAGTPILSTYGGQPPSLDATMWTGAQGASGSAGSYVPEGTLQLQFVDRSANKVVWNGTVSEKLDMERKKESLDRINKGITKLLKRFPPKGASPK